jgi:hypothetical protein
VTVIPRVYVDWSDAGTFTGTGENVTARVFARPGIISSRGRDQIRALTPPAAGTFQAELDNVSRDYSPENSTSPLDGLLYPGHKVRATVFIGTEVLYDSDELYDSDALYDGAPAYHVATNLLDDIPQNPAIGVQTVEIPSIGTLSRLVGKRISTPLYQSIPISTAMGYVLDAVGWPATDRVISTSTTTLDWWWLDDADAWDAIQALFFSEGPGAALYEDSLGRFVFEDRTYRILETRCTTNQMTLAATDTIPPITAMTYQSGIKDIVNYCSVSYSRRTAQSLAAVWSLGTTVTLAAAESRSFVARSSTGDPFTGAVTPVVTTDYTVSVGSLASVTLSRTSGAQVTVTITAGGSGATVTALQLRAQLVTVSASGSIANTVDASTSISRYGLRPFNYTTWPEISINVLQDLVNTVVTTYSVPQPMILVTAIGADDASTLALLRREVSDRISVADPTSGFASDVFIEQITVRVTDAGKVAVTFGCTKTTATGYAVWDTAEWDDGRWGY